jgi:hypothetical protein
MNIMIPRVVMSLWRLCDPDSSRYALGGVRFTCDAQGVTKAAACDGRYLGEFTWHQHGSFDPGEMIIPQYVCRLACRESKGVSELALAGDALRIDFEARMFKFVAVEGRFPRTGEVLGQKRKKKIESVERLMDPARMSGLLRIAAALVADSRNGCRIDFGADPADTLYVTAEHGGVTFQGALMPMCDD